MKRVTVKTTFRDKYDPKVIHKPGELTEFEDDRAAALAARGLVEILEEEQNESAEAENVKEETVKGKRGRGKTSKEPEFPTVPKDDNPDKE